MRATTRRVRTGQKRLSLLTAVTLLLGFLAAIAVPGVAHASVSTGDLVFQEDPGTGTEYITVSNASGGSQTRLTSNAGSLGDPDVSPDGSRIAYFKHKMIYHDGAWHGGDGIWVMNSDGSADTQITFPDTQGDSDQQFADSVPRWSTDGTKIVFTRHMIGGNYYVYSMNADGTGATNLTTGVTGANDTPAWSPDGSQVVYTHTVSGNPRLTVMDANGDNKHDVIYPYSCSSYQLQPDWSPDGTRIYYWGNCSGDTKLLYITSSDSFATAANSTEHMLNTPNTSVAHLRVSADGGYVFFDGVNSSDLYKVNTSTGAKTTITPTGGNTYVAPDPVGAAWSIKQFTVLGDSYSSGEGNPSFISPSDTDGCHRSVNAYAEVLNRSPVGMQLSSGGFVACSGATSGDIENGKHGESSQFNGITSTDNIVILTVGGNNVGFPTFAYGCVVGGCASGTTPYNTIENSITYDLPGQLDSFFDDLASYVGSKRVLVLGYPYLLPPSGASYSCSGLSSGSRTAAYQVESDLNGAIADAVARAGSPFEFVGANASNSPFAGHELCSSDPYFHQINWVDTYSGVNFGNWSYSYHPNDEGQAAYAKLVTQYLTANP